MTFEFEVTDRFTSDRSAPPTTPLRTDPMTLGAYVSDASIFRRVPQGVVEPASTDDIREALLTAERNHWPVTMRGGGTSVAGNVIGEGIIIDTSRHFNRILEMKPQEKIARVQPGVICDQLRSAAAEFGLTFGPDPSTHGRCTIGGMIANNACGSHSLQWGTTADNVVELTVMLPTGDLVRLSRGGSDSQELNSALESLQQSSLGLIRTELGRFPRQVSGYGLQHLTPENGFDVAKAFAGSEGTCGIIVEAVVALVEKPVATALAVLAFASVFDAAAAAPTVRRPGVATAEGMGADLVDALYTSTGSRKSEKLLPGAERDSTGQRKAGGWLFCETVGDTPAEAAERARHLESELANHPDHASVASTTVDNPDDVGALWKIRESAAGLVTRLPDGREAWPSWEDSAVPPSELAAYLRDLYELLDFHGLEGIPFGHFGEGCVHLRISFHFGTDEGLRSFRTFMIDASRLVARHGGSLSGEHGDGRARSDLLPYIYSEPCLRLFSDFKAVFDPSNVLNPGVLVRPDEIDDDVRSGPGQRIHEFIPLHALTRDEGSMVNAVNRCVGVGLCRTESDAMCPSFQITHDEVHSTRGRARILSEMFRGEVYPDGTASEDVKDALDLCLSCRACASECPVNVDMATYKSEFLNQHYSTRRRPMSHYTMGWLPLLSHLLHILPGAGRVATGLLQIGLIERLVMRAGGVDGSRRMVRFAGNSFQKLQRRKKKRRTSEERVTLPSTVVLWPDSFSNHLDTTVPTAATKVLEALGMRVVVPTGFVCCGLTWHSTGQLDMVKRVLTQTLNRVYEHLDGTTPIVCLEPSCASMLVEEAPQLFPDDRRVQNLARQVITLGELVSDHTKNGGIWPFEETRIDALSQVHCHERSRSAHDGTSAALNRLGIDESLIKAGCCGLAGNWGFEPGHAQMSRDLGERELFPRIRELDSDAAVLADGFSCRTHIREETGVEAKHLAQVLCDALPDHFDGSQSLL